MAHKTLIGGTAYEISGGKTRVGGTNYSISGGKTRIGGTNYSISFGPSINPVLNNNTWDVVGWVSSQGLGPSYWSVGDTKSVVLNGTIGTGLTLTNQTYWSYILGFNHNNAYEGTGIHFQGFKTAQTGGISVCLCDSYYGQQSSTTISFNISHSNFANRHYGWKNCDMRYDILGGVHALAAQNAASTTATNPVTNTFMSVLPSDLRNVMQPMTKYTDNVGGKVAGGQATDVTTTIDYITLLAEFELFGSRTLANSYEQSYQAQYAYYSVGNSKINYRHDSTSITAYYWSRSPEPEWNAPYCVFGRNATTHEAGDPRMSYGICPIFKV